MKRIWMILLTMLCVVSAAVAQRVSLSTSEQAFLKEQVINKVKSFQESYKTIADSSIPFNKKTSKDGYIDVAMEDFLEDAIIRVTSLDGKSHTEKPVKQYLKRLALLSKRVLDPIEIEISDPVFTTDFVPDSNKGKDWYAGEIRFTRTSKTNQEKQGTEKLSDEKLVAEIIVHAHRRTISSNGKEGALWDIKFGDIKTRTMD